MALKDLIVYFQAASHQSSEIIATNFRLPLEIEGHVEVPIKLIAVLNSAHSEEIVKPEVLHRTKVNASLIRKRDDCSNQNSTDHPRMSCNEADDWKPQEHQHLRPQIPRWRRTISHTLQGIEHQPLRF